jgi:hypothetical protein
MLIGGAWLLLILDVIVRTATARDGLWLGAVVLIVAGTSCSRAASTSRRECRNQGGWSPTGIDPKPTLRHDLRPYELQVEPMRRCSVKSHDYSILDPYTGQIQTIGKFGDVLSVGAAVSYDIAEHHI